MLRPSGAISRASSSDSGRPGRPGRPGLAGLTGLPSFHALRPSLVLLCAALAAGSLAPAAGCDVGEVDPSTRGGGPHGGRDLPTPQCDGPFGAPQDPSELPACCTGFVGGAHCLPADDVPDVLRGRFATCDDGGTCVPDPFIATGGVYEPPSCTSIQGAAGVCLSGCIPEVQQAWDLLPQDGCYPDERCVPCTNPLDGTDTGACLLKYTCDGGFGGDDACPHTGPDVLDPSTLTSCGPDAHCLTAVLVPDALRDRLADCPAPDGDDKCVPDDFIRTGGNFIPDTCRSVGNVEGRCLSTVLPEIHAQANVLRQGTCDAGELCAPCYNPLDRTDTGACRLSCDAPAESPMGLPACCDGRGTCVPASAAGDDADRLGADTCDEDAGLVCAPNVFLQPGFVPDTCDTGLGWLGDEYSDGRCLPDCLPGVDSFLLSRGSCDDGMKCAPCLKPPFATDSGACD
ncbi:MAG TPA: hypothetical protein VHE35_12905 [Kofleriaceae bacterium]|nr:hypothetical protein [Kofleriaceae bacterium]